jgi:transposase
MNIPLELLNVFNWGDSNQHEIKPVIPIANADAFVENYLSAIHPVYGHMIQFGIDYHDFMDNNDPVGLLEFIDKYKNDKYGKLASFAKGLEKDIEAVKNTLLYPDISNGVVEGINNDIKSVKRVGGGKAKVDLLAAKMVIRHQFKLVKVFESAA